MLKNKNKSHKLHIKRSTNKNINARTSIGALIKSEKRGFKQ